MQKAIKILINSYNKKLWPIVILCGALFGLFYQSIVISGTIDRFKEFWERIPITQKVTVISLDVPTKDTYLLKLKGGLKEHNQPEKVFINGHLLKEYGSERKQVSGTKYRVISSNLIHKGENELKLCFSGDHFPFRLRIICSNYRKALNNKTIFLLFDSSKHHPNYLKIDKIISGSLFGILFLYTFWSLSSYGWIRILYLSERKIYLYGLISFIPCLLIFSVYYLVSFYSPYHIVLSSLYFWNFSITLIVVLDGGLISYNLWKEYRKSRRLFKPIKLFKPTIANQNVVKSIEYIKNRELADKFILLFMVFIMLCIPTLIIGLKLVAEQFASIAYVALVIGVGIKFVKFIKEERAKNEKE